MVSAAKATNLTVPRALLSFTALQQYSERERAISGLLGPTPSTRPAREKGEGGVRCLGSPEKQEPVGRKKFYSQKSGLLFRDGVPYWHGS